MHRLAMRPVRALSLVLALAALGACAAPAPGLRGEPPPQAGRTGLSPEDARAVLLRFGAALEAERWAEAWSLLSPRWRAASTPERLAADWRGAGPVAREAVGRVQALLAAGGALEEAPGEGGAALRLPVGAGRAARLVAEAGRWRVDALE